MRIQGIRNAENGFVEDPLTRRIIKCIFKVHGELGPGFLESVYRRALAIELRKEGMIAEMEKDVVVRYDGEEVGRHRLDILVDEQIVLELKAAEALSSAHYTQLRSYLKATNLSVGLLVNFGSESADIRRIESPK